MKVDMTTRLGPLTLRNPVLTASGTFGYGAEYAAFFPLERLGAVVVKGISPFPWEGNPMPRAAEVAGGMLNAIGLHNPGVDTFIADEHYLPSLRRCGTQVVVNIWGRSVEDYAEVARRLDAETGIAALEINISCPNIKEGGVAFGTDPKLAAKVVTAVRRATKLPLITKLSPNVTSAAPFAKAVVEAGSDIVSLINTLIGMAIDIETRKPKIANVTGGLSGPAVKPVAVRMVYEAANAVNAPIIGMGGIMNAADAVEFMLAGASAVAVGTANFSDPTAAVKVVEGIKEYLIRHGHQSPAEIVGAMRR